MSFRRGAIGFVVAAGIAVAVWFFMVRRHVPVAKLTGAERAVGPIAQLAPATPSYAAERPGDRTFIDRDPDGPLRLEGQVLDEHDQPVGKATVTLSSVPPRDVVTEDDGSFAFDKLVAHTYEGRARSADLVGGPVQIKASTKNEPVVIHLHRGVTLSVNVVSEATAKDREAPIANAAVAIRGNGDVTQTQTQTADSNGAVTFHGVDTGTVLVSGRASGFGDDVVVVAIPSGITSSVAKLVLRRGAPVSGHVVDEEKHPIANVRVVARDVASAFASLGKRDGELNSATTNEKGEFTIAALPQGSYRLFARDGEHEPGSSATIAVDGVRATTSVDIKLVGGGVLAGTVVTADGQPAPFAAVRVVPKNAAAAIAGNLEVRETTTDASGTFVLMGMSRGALRVRASSDQAVSGWSDTDLTFVREHRDLKLTLDVAGVIAGTVVDGAGQPIAEAHVSAVADFSGSNASLTAAMLGTATATTDGGGAFKLYGIGDGNYRVDANLQGANALTSSDDGVVAKAGDRNVRIVVSAPGGVKGHIVIEASNGGTSAPSYATVSSSWRESTQATAGDFELDDLTPGAHDLQFRGSEFLQFDKADVMVASGKVLDLGTITVKRGRTLRGRVVDSSGNPVAGAQVSVAKYLTMVVNHMPGATSGGNDLMGIRTATSQDDGGFTVFGVPAEKTNIIAEHATLGQSDGVAIVAGDDDPALVTLTLKGVGSIAGKITRKGVPVSGAFVAAQAEGSDAPKMSTSATDGTFVIDKVSVGKLNLMAMLPKSGTQVPTVDVVVVAGQQTTANIEVPVGDVNFTVHMKLRLDRGPVDQVHARLFHGAISLQTYLASLGSGGTAIPDDRGAGMVIWWATNGDAPDLVFQDLAAGDYTVCVRAFSSSSKKVAIAVDTIDCVPVTLTATPVEQAISDDVPSLNKIPPKPTPAK